MTEPTPDQYAERRWVGPCDGWCTTEPEETCPQHGRGLVEWRDIASEQIGRANAAEAERDRLREGVQEVISDLRDADENRTSADPYEYAERLAALLEDQ